MVPHLTPTIMVSATKDSPGVICQLPQLSRVQVRLHMG